MEINSFLDKNFINSLTPTKNPFFQGVRITGGTVVKRKAAIAGSPGRSAVPAVPAVYENGRLIKKEIPSQSAIPAIPEQREVKGGQWFNVSTKTFDHLKDMVARLARQNFFPRRDLRLGNEFSNPERNHQYVVGYFAENPKEFRQAYKKAKKWQ